MNDPANSALKSHKRGYLQGPGVPLCGGVALIFLLTNDLNRAGGPTEQTDLSNSSCQYWTSNGAHKHSHANCEVLSLSVQLVNANWKP